MARPRKEKELNHYHFVSVRLSDIEQENVDKAATTAGRYYCRPLQVRIHSPDTFESRDFC